MALPQVHIYFTKLHGLEPVALFDALWTRLEDEAEAKDGTIAGTKTMEVEVRNHGDFYLSFAEGEWEDDVYFAEVEIDRGECTVCFDKHTRVLTLIRKTW